MSSGRYDEHSIPTLRVARREPHATVASKVLALHTLGPGRETHA